MSKCKRPLCFIVQLSDLMDREKNPNLYLSFEKILENDEIPKKWLSGGKENE